MTKQLEPKPAPLTAHEVARQLLAGPDAPVVMATACHGCVGVVLRVERDETFGQVVLTDEKAI